MDPITPRTTGAGMSDARASASDHRQWPGSGRGRFPRGPSVAAPRRGRQLRRHQRRHRQRRATRVRPGAGTAPAPPVTVSTSTRGHEARAVTDDRGGRAEACTETRSEACADDAGRRRGRAGPDLPRPTGAGHPSTPTSGTHASALSGTRACAGTPAAVVVDRVRRSGRAAAAELQSSWTVPAVPTLVAGTVVRPTGSRRRPQAAPTGRRIGQRGATAPGPVDLAGPHPCRVDPPDRTGARRPRRRAGPPRPWSGARCRPSTSTTTRSTSTESNRSVRRTTRSSPPVAMHVRKGCVSVPCSGRQCCWSSWWRCLPSF